MQQPCGNCPFRQELAAAFGLRPARRAEIVAALRADGTFSCHKTVDYDDDDGIKGTSKMRPCVGAAATMIREGTLLDNFTMRLALMVGYLRPPEEIRVDDVCASLDAWEDHCRAADLL